MLFLTFDDFTLCPWEMQAVMIIIFLHMAINQRLLDSKRKQIVVTHCVCLCMIPEEYISFKLYMFDVHRYCPFNMGCTHKLDSACSKYDCSMFCLCLYWSCGTASKDFGDNVQTANLYGQHLDK